MPVAAPPPAVAALRNAGQQLWLDDLSRQLLMSGTLGRLIGEVGVTGVTSNPVIVSRALASDDYREPVAELASSGLRGDRLLMALTVADVRWAADLLASVWEESAGDDGWVSVQLSPEVADDARASVAAARELHEQVDRRNVLVKMPATEAGIVAIEDVIAAGIPVTATLLLTPTHATAAAAAYVRGIERRREAGVSLDVRSYAALYVSRWDARIPDGAPQELIGQLGIAVAGAAYAAVSEEFASDRFTRLAGQGARPQTLLFASTGGRDPRLDAAHYVERLIARGTANTVPPAALQAFAAGGRPHEPLAPDTEEARGRLARYSALGLDLDVIGAELQGQAAAGFAEAWSDSLARVERLRAVITD